MKSQYSVVCNHVGVPPEENWGEDDLYFPGDEAQLSHHGKAYIANTNELVSLRAPMNFLVLGCVGYVRGEFATVRYCVMTGDGRMMRIDSCLLARNPYEKIDHAWGRGNYTM